MLGLATYVMRGPLQAALSAAALLLFGMVFPPIAWLSGAVVGLVFLRNGASASLQSIAVAAGLVSVVFFLLTGSVIPSLHLLSVFWVPVIVLALTLRETVSLGTTLLVAGLIATVVVIAIFVVLGDPSVYWNELINKQFPVAQLSKQLQLDETLLRAAIEKTATLMSGAFVTFLLIGVILSLFIARYWQAGLYNPGGFKVEFHHLRLSKLSTLLGITVIALAVVLKLPILTNVAPIAITLFFFQGLAVVHYLVQEKKMSTGWLVGIYLLILSLFPYSIVLLGALGLADNGMKIRKQDNN
jgi:hypothetical protein